MVYFSLSTEQATNWLSQKYIAIHRPRLEGEDYQKAVSIVSFDIKVGFFNLSTLLYIGAIVSAIFMNFPIALCLGALAYCLRKITSRSLDLLTLPYEPQDGEMVARNIAEDPDQCTLLNAGLLSGKEGGLQKIFPEWRRHVIEICDCVLWRRGSPVRLPKSPPPQPKQLAELKA